LTIEEIIQSGLHEFLDRFQQRLNDVSKNLFQTFFTLT
jgi:uncharacterized alpha-E superfamily protein